MNAIDAISARDATDVRGAINVMAYNQRHFTLPNAALLAGIVLCGVIGAALITQLSSRGALAATILLAVVLLSFVSLDFSLYMLIGSMLLGPEVIIGGMGGGTTAGRGITLRLDDFLLTVVCLAWLARGAILKEIGLLPKTPLNRPIFAYSVIVILATMWGMMTGQVKPLIGFFFALKYLQYFVLYFMVANYCRDRTHVRNLILALLITCALVSLYGIAQIPAGERVSAPFEGAVGEPNTFGGYLVLMLALIMSLSLLDQPTIRLLLLGLGGMVLITLAATLSRSAYLALIPLLATFLVLSEKRLPIAVALLACVVLFFTVLPQSVVSRITYTWSQPEETGQVRVGRVRLDTSTSARLEAWTDVLTHRWPKHPVLGYGVTGSGFLDTQYPRILVETGLAGFIAFVWLLRSILRMGLDRYREAKDPFLRAVSLGFVAGSMSLLTHALGSNTFIIVRIMEPFWFLAGLVAMIPAIAMAQEPESKESPRNRNTVKNG